MRVYCKKCDKLVKSTVKKNWWLMYDHVFLLTRRSILLVVFVTSTILMIVFLTTEFGPIFLPFVVVSFHYSSVFRVYFGDPTFLFFESLLRFFIP